MQHSIETCRTSAWPRFATLLAALAFAASPSLLYAATQEVDVHIRGGTVIDGTGTLGFTADVLVVGDTITYVGTVRESDIKARLTIDARGKVVSPGFIDVHPHSDPLGGSLDNFLAQGVTSILLGQDGRTAGYLRDEAPTLKQWRKARARPNDFARPVTLEQWMRKVDHHGIRLNVATLVGHGTVREIAGVGSNTIVTENQHELMQEILNGELDAGAYGMSTGLEYVPGRNASREELVRLTKIVGDRAGVVMSHLRSEEGATTPSAPPGTMLMNEALEELLDYGQHARVHVSHIKVIFGQGGPSQAHAILERMRKARAAGIDVTADVYPYYAGVSNFYFLYPLWAREKPAFEQAAANDRSRLAEDMRARIEFRGGPHTALVLDGEYAGKTLDQIAALQNKSFVDVVIDWGYGGPRVAHFTQDPRIQQVFIAAPEVAIASDGAAEMHHPRSYGTNAKIFDEFTSTGQLDLRAAIHKMTGLPARISGIEDRGILGADRKADIVVFDPRAVRANASWTEPTRLASGFDYVLVNGRVALHEDQIVEAHHGRVLRRAPKVLQQLKSASN